MCNVNVTATLEEESIHVEESGDPNSLVYAVEGEDPAQVTRLGWRDYIRTHPAQSLRLQLQPALPHWRLNEVHIGFIWLVRKIVQSQKKRNRLKMETRRRSDQQAV